MFGEILKALRKKKGLTQKQLAAKLFVDQTAVSYWEQGKAKPDFEKQIALADFFEVSVDELLGRQSDTTAMPKETLIHAIEHGEFTFEDFPTLASDHENAMYILGSSGRRDKIILTESESQKVKNVLKAMFPEKFKDE